MADEQPYTTGRSYSSAEISRRVQQLSPLQRDMLDLFEQYERQHAAANSAPTIARLLILAESYTHATTADATPADRARLATEVAEELTLAEAGTIRRAAKAVELGTTQLIRRAAANGTDRATIARELGVTPRYVRRVLTD